MPRLPVVGFILPLIFILPRVVFPPTVKLLGAERNKLPLLTWLPVRLSITWFQSVSFIFLAGENGNCDGYPKTLIFNH